MLNTCPECERRQSTIAKMREQSERISVDREHHILRHKALMKWLKEHHPAVFSEALQADLA
jgi:hypothetical protein